MSRDRLSIAALTLSASALVGIAAYEGYRDTAYIPVPGDRPTLGFGQANGVKMGDKTDPVRALIRLNADADQHAQMVRKCAPVPMHQHEFDAFVSLIVNIGPGKVGKDGFCINKQGNTAIIPRKLLAGDYKGACEAIRLYANFNGRPLSGLVKRREAEYRTCIGEAAQ